MFLTKNDEVEQAVLSKILLLSSTCVRVLQCLLLFVCLRNLFESRTSCHIERLSVGLNILTH